VIDDAQGTPKHYRGIVPRLEEASAQLTIKIEASGNLMSEMATKK
jgi:hypothetical protein